MSSYNRNDPSSFFPQFEASEVIFDKKVGQGEFGIVYSIGSIIHAKGDEGEISEIVESEKNKDNSYQTNNGNRHQSPSSLVRSSSSKSPVRVVLDLDAKLGFEDATPPTTSTRRVGQNGFILSFDNPVSVMSKEIDLTDDSSLSDDEEDEVLLDEILLDEIMAESNVSKGYMSAHVIRQGRPRYAAKRLRKDLKDKKLLCRATADLASEAIFLKTLRHPNICRMRGTIGEPGRKDFTIIMDRLTMTLRDKMLNWKKLDDRGSFFLQAGKTRPTSR